ncbi:DUF2975 domain-containing protein [Clostridium gasigenes]|uniref:DUF2975 domain-containing protein n=1 Tax=Clostridium gasigenes TaxID=94869 RepID=UPI001C0AA7BF|nr:DUF2975 domain-containing protein [Clostridium gasigenes]MBU3137091.1 DUF2975 domain-containing protein [Clostridium gasigenes]
MKSKFDKYEILIKISMVVIFCMSIFIGVVILNLEPNVDNISSEFKTVVLDKSVFLKAYIILGIVTLLFEVILYKMHKLINEINNKEIISQKSNKILKSMGRTLLIYIIVTIFTGQINKILFINNPYLIYKNETINKIMRSWLFNTGFNAVIIVTMIILLIILLEVLIEGIKIKEENDLTV